MSVLNEIFTLLNEGKQIELIPISDSEPIEPKGSTVIGDSVISKYEANIRDCKEHDTIDGAIESAYKGLRSVNLSPFTKKGQEWFGSFNRDLGVGEGGLGNLHLRTNDGEKVTNAYLQIDLYKNSQEEYEVSSRIIKI